MTRDEILRTLAARRADLARRGVVSLALFGSAVRGEMDETSDIDLLVDFDPAAQVDLFDLMDLETYLAKLLRRPVDLVPRASLKRHVRDRALREAVDVF